MSLPMINSSPRHKSTQMNFGGYTHVDGAPDGSIWDMENITSDHYPLIAPRNKRKISYTGIDWSNGMIEAGGKLAWVKGTSFYYDNDYKGTVTNDDKEMVVIGNRVIIFPDKKYYDFVADEFDSLETEYISGANEIIFRDGSIFNQIADANCIESTPGAFANFKVGDAITISGATEDKNNSPYIYPIIKEISNDSSTLRFYEFMFNLGNSGSYTYEEKSLPENTFASASNDFYVAALATPPSLTNGSYTINQTEFIQISAAGIATINTGDPKYYIEKADASGEQTGQILYQIISAQFVSSWIEMEVKVYHAAKIYQEANVITIKREVPSLKHIVEHDNRLWGVDTADESIRCCNLGNPFVWNDFAGMSYGCWQVSIGSSGAFTGSITFANHPLFFKENGVYELYGNAPYNFQLMHSERLGVKEGSAKSLAMAGENLLYHSRQGIMLANGGPPINISAAFGDVDYSNAVAGSDGKKYYISMKDETNDMHQLFVFDTQKQLWHREDNSQVVAFAYTDDLYMLNAGGDVIALDPKNAEGTEESAVAWFVEFGDFTDNSPNKKGVSKYQIRLDVGAGEVTLEASYDGGSYEPIKTIASGDKQSYTIPFYPRRADHYRLKISGTDNDVKIYSITKELYAASEI